MSPESQMEEALCLGALSLPDPELREKFLDQACAGNPRLRAAVEEVLRSHAEAEDFFARGRSAVSVPGLDAMAAEAIREGNGVMEPLDEQIGSRVGRYKLLQKIGEGGCGTVYMAEQDEPVKRQVALKVIKLGMDTKNVIARFEAERQALAMMDHPNIARVLDAGATETGRPFFVMELVRGTRITKYCDDHNLNTVERLRLFIQICRAIQHAHQKGIIHRDIKPSNVLVTLQDGVPVPKVIDFGIAKATEGRLTDNTLFTAMEQFVGTPAYMSPEQAEVSGLDVDTRSDIYSLGVLLYELLTGRTPFDSQALMKSGLDEMRRTLREKEPQLPSTMITSLKRTELTLTADHRQAEPPKLISQLKGDLDWIVMKALEKDRNRRYETANGLALDIQRYLDSEPVLARPPSQLYRFKKLVRRNKIVFASGVAVGLALLTGLGLSTWMYLREKEAHIRESDAREREAELRSDAEDRAKITQAVMFVKDGKYEEANQLLEQIKTAPSQPSLDGVSAFRSVGEWLAIQGRWQQSAKCYGVLINIDKLNGWNQVASDYQAYGVVLAQAGDTEQYDHFCRMAATNFMVARSGGILKSCLLFPLNKAQMEVLLPLEESEEKAWSSKAESSFSEWAWIPMSLWKCRHGDFDESSEFCREGLNQKLKYPACDAALLIIRGMADYQRGRVNEACSELQQGRELVEDKKKSGIDRGKSGTGFWYDWDFASQLLQEASAMVDCNALQPRAEP